MDAVGRDHDVGRGAHTVGERDDGLVVILLEADAPVAGVDDATSGSRSTNMESKSARCMP